MGDYASFIQINDFVANSVLSEDILRLNRFIGVLDGTGESFAWNIYRVNCPAFRLDIEPREINMVPQMYIKNWVYDDLEVSYIESSKLKIRKFFFNWMSKALSVSSYARGYYDDVKVPNFKITAITSDGSAGGTEVFNNVFPCEVTSIDFNMGENSEQLALTTVRFKYVGHSI